MTEEADALMHASVQTMMRTLDHTLTRIPKPSPNLSPNLNPNPHPNPNPNLSPTSPLHLPYLFALPSEQFGAPTLAARRTIVVTALPRVAVAPRGGMLQPGAGTRYPLGVEDAAW